ncbi:hypothetical protein GCM10010319_31610 [Streptomyces blastmyceticus]|uniref:Uncharacterized protein n=2 Tax=Streptomyces blastmyceticus TaxID=68180 RepID=A0ABP3GUL2_9ACTN
MERRSGVPGEPSASAQRAANLRMIALASVVALAIVLPLAAATAGPAGPASPEKARGRTGSPKGERGRTSAPLAAAGSASDLREPGPEPAPSPAVDAGEGFDGQRSGGDDVRDSTRCGPELAAPEGVEAQTCVLRQGADTWARTYYRNATGGPLTAVLTLMDPEGRTVEVQCRMGPSDDPDGCETPHAPTVRDPRERDAYSAVAEIAGADGRLLLRSGSNSPGGRAG